MSANIPIEEVQSRLKELIHQMAPGDEIIITEDQQPVAKLVNGRAISKTNLRPPPGLGKGFVTILANDDEHLEHFAEYMP